MSSIYARRPPGENSAIGGYARGRVNPGFEGKVGGGINRFHGSMVTKEEGGRRPVTI